MKEAAKIRKWSGILQQVPDTLCYLTESLAYNEEIRSKILYMISNRDHSFGLYEKTLIFLIYLK